MSTYHDDGENLESTLSTLLRPSECQDWASKLQLFSQYFWQILCTNPDAAIPYIEDFLVLPALRGTTLPPQTNDCIESVFLGIADLRDNISRIETTQQADFDDAFYEEEKMIFEEAEMYRAELLLFSRGSLPPTEREEFEIWWSSRPSSTVDVEPTRLSRKAE
ncbi:MAG: hypothetical protein Q9210_003437 [Variospora velana]